jgi:hypothetical protein
MCDYSLESVKSRKAAIGDKLVTKRFTSTTGFASFTDVTVDEDVAVCLIPGTEVAFERPVQIFEDTTPVGQTPDMSLTAIFRKVNEDIKNRHHDALEFPGAGCTVLLQNIRPGQRATVLQLGVEEHAIAEQQRKALAAPIPAGVATEKV